MPRYLLLIICLFLPLGTAHSQGSHADAVKHRNECRLAEQVLTTGHPAPHREWARGYIPSCGLDAWGRTAAAEIDRMRREPESPEMGRAWNGLWLLHDANVFRVLMDIATDRSASEAARKRALLTLNAYVRPNESLTGNDFSQPLVPVSPRSDPCRRGWASGRQARYDGVPLPPNYASTIAALVARLRVDTTEPVVIQRIATCMGEHSSRGNRGQ